MRQLPFFFVASEQGQLWTRGNRIKKNNFLQKFTNIKKKVALAQLKSNKKRLLVLCKITESSVKAARNDGVQILLKTSSDGVFPGVVLQGSITYVASEL